MTDSNATSSATQLPLTPRNGAQPHAPIDEKDAVNSKPSGGQDFALADLRLPTNFHEGIGVKRQLVAIPVRRPDKQWWIRVHPEPGCRLDTSVIEVQDQRETYLVSPALRDGLVAEVVHKTLALAVNRQGVVFIWPVRLPGADGRLDPWNEAARKAMSLAIGQWVRVTPHSSGYDVFTTTAELPEPEWPEQSFEELLRIAFRGRYITDPDHAVLRRLRGQE